jgi:hypothetical protein
MTQYKVESRPIPWKFETNTQGANRAHDAWAHLQQVQVTVGSWFGKMKYGVRGVDINGFKVDVSKLLEDPRHIFDVGYEWSFHDRLRIARDMMEWVFYAEALGEEGSVVGPETLSSTWYGDEVFGSGLVAVVQYRYTPVSVNVGTEFGSIETFEYGRNTVEGPNGYSVNGTPLSYVDMQRP